MDGLLLVALVLLMAAAAGTGAVVLLVVLAWRAAMAAVRSRVDAVRLRARTYGLGGAPDVAALRLHLRRAVTASAQVVAWAQTAQWPLGHAVLLQRRLDAAAAALDTELAALELEPDPHRRAYVLGSIRPRVGLVLDGAANLRHGLLAAASRASSADLRDLARECAVESRALQG